MKRTLGRLFARVSGVLRRVWRWVFPEPIRTETQLGAPRPDEPAPTVTREVVDLEWEEIRAALAVEPSVTAAAPEARKTVLRESPVIEPIVEPVAAPVVQEEPKPAYYKTPKYGRDPTAKMAAPRPKPAVTEPKPESVVEAKATNLEDSAVADLIARVDLFLNMGDLPVVESSEVTAVEPELLVEEPTVRQRVVEQLIAEAAPAPAVVEESPVVEELDAQDELAASQADSARAEQIAADDAVDEPFFAAEDTSQSEASEDAVAVAEAVDAPVEMTTAADVEAVATESVSDLLYVEISPSSTSAALEEPVVEERAAIEAAPIADELVAEEPLVVKDPVVETSLLDEELAADSARAEQIAADDAVDEPFFAAEDTWHSEASEDAVAVAEAVDTPVEATTAANVEAVATESVSDLHEVEFSPSSTNATVDEPMVEATVPVEEMAAVEATADEAAPDEAPLEEPVVVEAAAALPVDADAEIDAELEAAMTQADDALAAFATSHPEVASEVVAASDDEPPIVDEPWSPPPVMAEPYYEYDMPTGDEPTVAEAMAAEEPIADEPVADAALAEGGEPIADAALAENDEPVAEGEAGEASLDELPPEVAAMAAEEELSANEATIDAVTEAVEETLAAAADTLEAAAEIMADMPTDADALAAAAIADVVAAAEGAEEPVQAPMPNAAFRKPIPTVEIPTDYAATPESMHALYQLNFGGFEGPLDLLLHLIKRHHLDIFDIPIAFICERYLEHLKSMEELDIDVASEFLFMASELVHLKSRMLLPRPEGEVTDEEEVDPRAELVRRLLEYQKYKDVAERFGLLDRFGRDTFGRDPEPQPPPEGEAPLKEVGLFALTKAFQAALDRQKPEFKHQVMLEQVSVRARIRVLVHRFENQEPMKFETLLEGARRRIDIVVTFLALLEMGKLKLLRIFQNEDGVIYVYPRFDDVSLAFARLEGLDESQYAG